MIDFVLLDQAISSILKPYKVTTYCTDIFEEVLWSQLIQAQTLPKRCQFFPDDDSKFMYIGYAFEQSTIVEADKKTAIKYFENAFEPKLKRHQDFLKKCEERDDIPLRSVGAMTIEKAVEVQYVFNEEKQLHCFKVACSSFHEFILSKFREAIEKLNSADQLEKYQKQSAYYFMHETAVKELEIFLQKYYVDFSTSAFEQSLLAMADIEKTAKKATLFTSKKHRQIGLGYDFGIHGMSQHDQEKMKRFLSTKEKPAQYEYDLIEDKHCFYLDGDVLHETVIPAFKKYIQMMMSISSLILVNYQNASSSKAIEQRRSHDQFQKIYDHLVTIFNYYGLSKNFLEQLKEEINFFMKDSNHSGNKNINQNIEELKKSAEGIENRDNKKMVLTYLDTIEKQIAQSMKRPLPRYYYLTPINPQYLLAQKIAKAYAKLAIVSKGQISKGYVQTTAIDYEWDIRSSSSFMDVELSSSKKYRFNQMLFGIDAHIAAFMADPNRKRSGFAVKIDAESGKKVCLLIEPKQYKQREKFESDVYLKVKQIAESKYNNGIFSFFSFSKPAERNKRDEFLKYLESQGIKETGKPKITL